MTDAPFTPALASDERFSVLAALAEEAFSEIDLSVLLVYLVDLVPAHILPHLADQFHVMGFEGWEFAQTENERRQLLKQAIELHRYKGTPWAIQQVLTTLSMNGVVEEWFEYGGDPYFFKVLVDLSESGMNLDDYRRLETLILKYKNKRSTLEMISVRFSIRLPVHVANAALSGEVVTIFPFITTSVSVPAIQPTVAIGQHSWGTTTIYPRATS